MTFAEVSLEPNSQGVNTVVLVGYQGEVVCECFVCRCYGVHIDVLQRYARQIKQWVRTTFLQQQNMILTKIMA